MISVVLIEPENSGNLGSIARVMTNFDFEKLIIINPQCEINEESKKFAKNAQTLLKNAKIENMSILNQFDYIIGTTSKLGQDYNLPKVPITPEQLSKKITEIKSEKIALLIGRESDGLHNNEIEMCDFIVTIPTSPTYDSMNISHALAILLYELKKPHLEEKLMKKYTPMGLEEKNQIMKLLDIAMNNMTFENELKKETQRTVWKRMITKSFLTKKEASAVMGFLAKLKK